DRTLFVQRAQLARARRREEREGPEGGDADGCRYVRERRRRGGADGAMGSARRWRQVAYVHDHAPILLSLSQENRLFAGGTAHDDDSDNVGARLHGYGPAVEVLRDKHAVDVDIGIRPIPAVRVHDAHHNRREARVDVAKPTDAVLADRPRADISGADEELR